MMRWLVVAVLLTGCATSSWRPAADLCTDTPPKRIVEADRANKPFGIQAWSSPGATQVEVDVRWSSDRPEKRLAELNTVTCGFLGWAADQRRGLGGK